MSLFLNLLFETDSYSNEYLLAKIGFDTAENEPFNFHNFSSLQGFKLKKKKGKKREVSPSGRLPRYTVGDVSHTSDMYGEPLRRN